MTEPLEIVLATLRRLMDAAEAFAGSDPDMPSHAETVRELDAALDEAHEILDPAE